MRYRNCVRLIAFLALATACGGGDSVTPIQVVPPPPPAPPPPPPPAPAAVATVTLNQSSTTLVAGTTFQLVATLKDIGGNVLTDRVVSWATSSSTVATVSTGGLVTAASQGTAQITATSEGIVAPATVTVTPAGISAAGGTVTASNSSASVVIPPGALAVATQISVTSIANPQADPALVSGTAYDFGPTGTTFATPVTLSIIYPATATGTPSLFRVHKLIGTTWTLVPGSTVNTPTRTVTAPTSSFSTYAVLQITAPVATVTVSAPSGSVLNGATLQASALLKDAQGNTLTNRIIAWSVIPAANGTISAAGLFTAAVEGPVTIRATSETIVGNLAITVNPIGLLFKEIRLGGSALCGIGLDDKGYCWGFNTYGSVGDGTFVDRPHPVLISGGFLWKTIVPAIGDEGVVTCGLTTTGLAKCWGDYRTNPGDPDSPVPATVNGGHIFASLVTGDDDACGILTNTETWCFLENGFGQLGNGTSGSFAYTPVKVSDNHAFTKLSMGGQEHFCGITAQGEAWCWGYGESGTLGNGQFLNSAVPVKVIGGHNFTDIAASEYRVCALDAGGKPWCWGFNTNGVLGDGTTIDQAQPVAVVGNHVFTQISGARSNVCGLTATGEVWCWGENFDGYLGDGTTNFSSVPVKAATSVAFTSIFVGVVGTCGLTPLGAAYCWGGSFGLVPTRFTGQ